MNSELYFLKERSQHLYQKYYTGLISLSVYISKLRILDKKIDLLEMKVLNKYLMDSPV